MNLLGREIRIEGRLTRIARLDADRYQFLDDPETMIEALKKCGRRIDLFTFMQRLPETKPKYAYLMESDNLAVLPVSTFDHWWTKQINDKTRNMVRRAQKKRVQIREVPFDEALVRGIWEVYNECPIRQGRPFPHYGKSLERVHAEEATYLDSSTFIGAYLDDKMVGFVKLVTDEARTQANLMNIVSMTRHFDKAPTNALVACAVRTCADRGIPYLVYGNFVYGRKGQDGITLFKRYNGFSRVDVPRYYAPLTSWGRFAFRLALHKKFVDRVPEPILAKLRELRSLWYNRKLESAAEAS